MKKLLAKVALAVIVPIVFLLIVENLVRLAIKAGWIDYKPPMITQLPPGTEDWRKAHMTADRLRQPDPVLWWRPHEGPPYNEQGFKGPVAALPKPASTVRILIYGDSNTDGTPEDSWPNRVQEVLNRKKSRRKYEVLNAGVAGYSSHQGLLRFQQEAGKYKPDIVLVAFGWNDLATATRPDKSYHPPPPSVVFAERMMVKLRLYWTLKQMFTPQNNSPKQKTVPRVAIGDYRANLIKFIDVGRKHGAPVVLITRPHRETAEALRALENNFRSRVPEYNRMLLKVCLEQRSHCIDAQQYFEDLNRSEYWGDECHFTEAGRIEMGAFVVKELIRASLL